MAEEWYECFSAGKPFRDRLAYPMPHVLAALLLALAAVQAAADEPARQSPTSAPNIILIMADDMGFSDLGCYGSRIATPNLDGLAAAGLRFTQFYNTGRCCPTRAALLTGLYSHQAGVGHMVANRGTPAYQGYLNDRSVTIAEVLRSAGYRTYLAGKWHVGENRPHWPVDRGFERSYALVSGGTNYFRLDPGRTLARDDQLIQPEDDWYVTDAISGNAVEFLSEHPVGEPFFLYVGYTAPHWPLHALPDDIARYQGNYLDGWDLLRIRRHRRMIELGIVEPAWPLTPRDKAAAAWADLDDAAQQAWDLKMAVYAAQIDRMDQGIGRILSQLDTLGAKDNTLVLFLSDNGGCAEQIDRGTPGVPPGGKDSFLSYGLPWANASNTPFRRYKHWVHEGGIATPLIVRWPAVVREPGDLTHQPGHVIDVMATCLAAAGVEYPQTFEESEITPLEGKSLLPIFRGETRTGHDCIFWEHEGNRAVRRGQWKLVARHRGPWELYDLQADRTELVDLSSQQPQLVEQLAGQYEAWAERVGVVPWGRRRPAPEIPTPPRGS